MPIPVSSISKRILVVGSAPGAGRRFHLDGGHPKGYLSVVGELEYVTKQVQ